MGRQDSEIYLSHQWLPPHLQFFDAATALSSGQINIPDIIFRLESLQSEPQSEGSHEAGLHNGWYGQYKLDEFAAPRNHEYVGGFKKAYWRIHNDQGGEEAVGI